MKRIFSSSGASRPVASPAERPDPVALEAALRGSAAQNGETLWDLSSSRPRLVVFLRHLGCTFCREALAELARLRQRIERPGAGIVLVHLARDDRRAERLFEIYKLADVPRISDPDKVLYRAVGLGQGTLGELLGPQVLARSVQATCRGHLPGRSGGDTRQMPGVFLIHEGRILEEFRHRTSADQPDYVALADRVPAAGAA